LIDRVFVFNDGWMFQKPAHERMFNSFHRVLVDVPCSNSGVLARRPEARYAQDEKSLRSLRDLQTRIMNDTASYVRPGGLLIYATCSVWPEENEGVVDAFLSSHADYEQLSRRSTLPSLDGPVTSYRDGGYFSVLRRRV
jgi:16S rRNA (cytosine967-C5)-methyltransferase